MSLELCSLDQHFSPQNTPLDFFFNTSKTCIWVKCASYMLHSFFLSSGDWRVSQSELILQSWQKIVKTYKNILKEISWAVPAAQFISTLLIFDSTFSRQESLPWKYVSKDHWVINTQKIKIKKSQYISIFLGVHKLLVAAWGKCFNREFSVSTKIIYNCCESRLTDLCALHFNKTCKSEHTQKLCCKNNM